MQSNEEDWEDEIKENEMLFSDVVGRQDHKKSALPEKPLEEQYRPSVQYLTLNIPMEKIYFVDDTESLRLCQRALAKVWTKINWSKGYKT